MLAMFYLFKTLSCVGASGDLINYYIISSLIQ